MLALSQRSVLVPTRTSAAVAGRRPSVTVGPTSPWTGSRPNAGSTVPCPWTRVPPPAAKAATAGSDRNAGTSSADRSRPLPSSPTAMSQFQPYRRGVWSRWLSPEPKVNAAVSTLTPRMAPATVDRTGTAVRPRPVSSARPTPVTAVTGNEELASAPASVDRRSGGLGVDGPAVATRQAGQAPRTNTVRINSVAPRPSAAG